MFKKKILTSIVLASFLMPMQIEASSLISDENLETSKSNILPVNFEFDYFKLPLENHLADLRLEKNVVISIGEEEIQVKTKEETIDALLKSIEIELAEEDVVIPSLESKIKDGEEILILAHTSKIAYETEEEDFITKEIFTTDLILGEKKVKTKGVPKLTKKTFIEKSKNGILMKRVQMNEQVVQEKVDKEIFVGAKEEVVEKLPFETISKENPDLKEGVSNVIQKGIQGERVKTYYNDGVKREFIEEKLEIEPVTEIVEVGTKKEVAVSSKSGQTYTLRDFKFHGVIRSNNKKYTYYSQSVLPGGALKIPGRHVSKEGYVSDKDGYIVLASSSSIRKGTVIDTPFGQKGKVYDTCAACDSSWFDVYVK